MNGADYLVLSILLVSVGIGVFRGFVREAIGLVAWVLAIWLAWHHSEFIHPWLGGHLQSPEAKAWVARAIVFVGVVLLGDLVGFIASRIAHKAAGLSLVDRFLGLLFGLVRGFVIVGLCALPRAPMPSPPETDFPCVASSASWAPAPSTSASTMP